MFPGLSIENRSCLVIPQSVLCPQPNKKTIRYKTSYSSLIQWDFRVLQQNNLFFIAVLNLEGTNPNEPEEKHFLFSHTAGYEASQKIFLLKMTQ